MAQKKYLDQNGLSYLWGKIKSYVTSKLPISINVGGNAVGTAQSFTGLANMVVPISAFKSRGLVRESIQGSNDITLQGLINTNRANKLAFLPADQIIIEKTTDGGVTWVDAQVPDSTKQALFAETRPGIYLPKIDGKKNLLCGLRVTITGMKYDVPSGTAETEKYNYWNKDYVLRTERYCNLKDFYFWVSVSNDSMGITIQRATGAKPDNWQNVYRNDDYYMTGWSGDDYVLGSSGVFGGSVGQTNNYWNYRFIFMTKGVAGSSTMGTGYETSSQSISEIRAYGTSVWTSANQYMKADHLYSFDKDKNAIFPANVTASDFFGKINGHTVQSDVPANAAFTDTTYTLSQDALDGHKITLTPSAGNPATITIPDNDTTYSPATSSADGLMSAVDKEKLDEMSCTRVYDDTLEYKTQSGWSPVDITLQPFTAAAEASVEWELGAISSSSGANSNSSTRLRTVSYLPADIVEITPASGYRFVLMAYDNGTYIGAWNGTSYVKTATWLTSKVEASDIGQHDFRIVFARNPDSGTMTVDEKSNITITRNAGMTVGDLEARVKALEKALTEIELYTHIRVNSGVLEILDNSEWKPAALDNPPLSWTEEES